MQSDMEARLPSMAASEVCSADFLCWLHEGFYLRLPSELQKVQDGKASSTRSAPGELRGVRVVGWGGTWVPRGRALESF